VFGWLLLLQNPIFLQGLAGSLTGGLLSAWPAVLELMGRFIVVFVFNEIFANGISLVTKNCFLRSTKAHLFMALVSLGVVVAPLIADLGSTAAVASLPVFLQAIVSALTTMLSFAGLWGEVYLITGIALDGGKRTAPSWSSISSHVTIGVKKGVAYSGILVALLYSLFILLNQREFSSWGLT